MEPDKWGQIRQPRDEVLISYCRSATKPLWGLGRTFRFLIRCIVIHIYKALHLYWGQRQSGIFLPDHFTDFQHYCEVDYSNLIQSKTIWWEKFPDIWNSYYSPTSAKYQGYLLCLRALALSEFKLSPQKQVWQHFRKGCNPIFLSNCNLLSTTKQLKWQTLLLW